MKNNNNTLAVAALTGLMAIGSMTASALADNHAEKSSCKGLNSCTGKSAMERANCKTADGKEKHACKGLNSCKGQGSDGKNVCKGHGSCATDGSNLEKSGCNQKESSDKNVCKGHNGCATE